MENKGKDEEKAVRFSVRSAARADIFGQWDWYISQGALQIAEKFDAAVEKAFENIKACPMAGSPRRSNNPRMEGLRAWPIKGFDEMRIYYFAREDRVVIVRVLHDKRDTAAILEKQR